MNTINKTFGNYTVVKRVYSDKYSYTMVQCKCKYGVEKIVRLSHLKNKQIKSCGCLRKERVHCAQRSRSAEGRN